MPGYLAIKDEGDEYKYHEVPDEVYYYVKQLEEYIKHPEESKLLEVYKDRFNGVYCQSGQTARLGRERS